MQYLQNIQLILQQAAQTHFITNDVLSPLVFFSILLKIYLYSHLFQDHLFVIRLVRCYWHSWLLSDFRYLWLFELSFKPDKCNLTEQLQILSATRVETIAKQWEMVTKVIMKLLNLVGIFILKQIYLLVQYLLVQILVKFSRYRHMRFHHKTANHKIASTWNSQSQNRYCWIALSTTKLGFQFRFLVSFQMWFWRTTTLWHL